MLIICGSTTAAYTVTISVPPDVMSVLEQIQAKPTQTSHFPHFHIHSEPNQKGMKAYIDRGTIYTHVNVNVHFAETELVLHLTWSSGFPTQQLTILGSTVSVLRYT